MFLFKRWGIIFFFLLGVIDLYAQSQAKVGGKNLNDLRSSYESFEENDEKAIPLVRNYLDRAKSDRNPQHIFQGYKDLIYYTKDRDAKLIYADSCVVYSIKSENQELISHAYLTRGIVYYFFFKKYQPALDEYIKAYDYSSNIKDEYLKNSIVYHLGVVKSYLGYYEEALNLFTKCIAYFAPIIKSNAHPNIIFNNQKGYFNSLHQQAICYQNMNNLAKSDSIVTYGLSILPRSKEFALEKAYFLKCKGVSEFRKGNYEWAIKNLSDALPELKKINDFTWASVCYFYIGKSLLQINETEKAISNFIKVDSIFQKQNFILPEVRGNYEILINHYHETGDSDKELFFTKQLLKADNILTRDFKYLSSKIYKEYDTKALMKKQRDLENLSSNTLKLLIGSILVIATLIITLFYRNRKQKEVQKQYLELERRLINDGQVKTFGAKQNANGETARKESKSGIPENVVEDL